MLVDAYISLVSVAFQKFFYEWFMNLERIEAMISSLKFIMYLDGRNFFNTTMYFQLYNAVQRS